MPKTSRPIFALAALALSGLGLRGQTAPVPSWSVKQQGNVLAINYGSGDSFPQFAALHLDSGYLRLVSSKESGWGTSIVLPPAFWERDTTQAGWKTIDAPFGGATVIKFAASKDRFYALAEANNQGRLYVASAASMDQWKEITVDPKWGRLRDIDTDGELLWVAADGGVLVSPTNSENFTSSYSWSWDSTLSVDFHRGFGWSAIVNWGTLSGPNRKTPAGEWKNVRGDLPWGAISMAHVLADPLDPENIAYADGYRTTDAGVSWKSIGHQTVDYAVVIDGQTVIFSSSAGEYSLDRGTTWRKLGMVGRTIITDPDGGQKFLIGTNSGVYGGVAGGPWQPAGLADRAIRALGVFNGKVIAADHKGGLHILQRSAGAVYRQGAPVTHAWWTDGEKLIVLYWGQISKLVFLGLITFSPPGEQSFTASVESVVFGEANLAERLGEAFKTVFLSSMNVSPQLWDAEKAFVDEREYEIGSSGSLIGPPVSGTKFGLKGGTSEWKKNAPTMTIQFMSPVNVSGWVTASKDPNDDNIGMWAGFDSVVRSWSYTITASK